MHACLGIYNIHAVIAAAPSTISGFTVGDEPFAHAGSMQPTAFILAIHRGCQCVVPPARLMFRCYGPVPIIAVTERYTSFCFRCAADSYGRAGGAAAGAAAGRRVPDPRLRWHLGRAHQPGGAQQQRSPLALLCIHCRQMLQSPLPRCCIAFWLPSARHKKTPSRGVVVFLYYGGYLVADVDSRMCAGGGVRAGTAAARGVAAGRVRRAVRPLPGAQHRRLRQGLWCAAHSIVPIRAVS